MTAVEAVEPSSRKELLSASKKSESVCLYVSPEVTVDNKKIYIRHGKGHKSFSYQY